MTPEEAEAYLAAIRQKRQMHVPPPIPPTNLSSTDLNDWYAKQKRIELLEKQRKQEAEDFLKSYQLKLDHTQVRQSGSEETEYSAESISETNKDNNVKEQELSPNDDLVSNGKHATSVDQSISSSMEWRNLICQHEDSKFPPEIDRYHLYVAYACPWSHRTTIVRNIKGLQEVIGITYVHPTWQYTKPDVDDHRGWVFGSKEGEPLTNTSGVGRFPLSWGEEDQMTHSKTIREIYEKSGDTTGKYILPILYDKKEGTIVSNESSEIMRMLNCEFNSFSSNPDLDLYPSGMSDKIDEVNAWIYPTINNGVYRCGLASTQEEYDDAIDALTESFDTVEMLLKNHRFITGDVFTEADVRLFVTLLRFDEVYDVYFKCNTRSVTSTPTVLNYVRDIYQMSGITETCRIDMIKAHYFTSHVELNKYSIIPRGDNFEELLKQPHGRDSMSMSNQL
jgi:glutathionyl-hydroquinone reductase